MNPTVPRLRIEFVKPKKDRWPTATKIKPPTAFSKNLAIYRQPREVDFYRGEISGGLSATEQWASSFFPARALVLDIGCAAGREAIVLAQKGFRVVGVDDNPRALKVARAEAKKRRLAIRYKSGLFPFIHFPSQSFEVVFLPSLVVGHTRPVNNRIRLLREAVRIVKQNGLVAVEMRDRESEPNAEKNHPKFVENLLELRKTDPNAEYGDKISYRSSTRVGDKQKDIPIVYHHHSRAESMAELDKAGLKVVDTSFLDSGGSRYIMYVCKPKK